MRIADISSINRRRAIDAGGLIGEAEDVYANGIKVVAEAVAKEKDEKPIILLSGPSGSGKTTTALRLEKYLDNAGITTHTISMDNYFIPMDDPRNALDEDGKIDLESPKRLDAERLAEDMDKLIRCQPINVPIFDFASQTRTDGAELLRGEGDLVIFEGIHALNPEITGRFADCSSGVYVSVRTRLRLASGELLHPSKIRLMRRIVRDGAFRGRPIEDTLRFYTAVERGERLYIMPYKHLAAHDIDTFIEYEAAVYASTLQKQLLEVSGSVENYASFSDMERVFAELNAFTDEDKGLIPQDSLVREFIGGSTLSYV